MTPSPMGLSFSTLLHAQVADILRAATHACPAEEPSHILGNLAVRASYMLLLWAENRRLSWDGAAGRVIVNGKAQPDEWKEVCKAATIKVATRRVWRAKRTITDTLDDLLKRMVELQDAKKDEDEMLAKDEVAPKLPAPPVSAYLTMRELVDEAARTLAEEFLMEAQEHVLPGLQKAPEGEEKEPAKEHRKLFAQVLDHMHGKAREMGLTWFAGLVSGHLAELCRGPGMADRHADILVLKARVAEVSVRAGGNFDAQVLSVDVMPMPEWREALADAVQRGLKSSYEGRDSAYMGGHASALKLAQAILSKAMSASPKTDENTDDG